MEKPTGANLIRMSDCHPDVKHFSKGMCQPCYKRDWNHRNKDKIAVYSRRYKKKYPQRKLAMIRRWHKQNPEKSRLIYRRRALKRLGTTPEEYNQLYTSQKGCCKICGKFEEKLHADHNHTTGKFRGLLCRGCNHGLGNFMERPEYMLLAIEYLANANEEYRG